MISKIDIQKLADLARIEIKEEEMASLAGEMDAILEYVGQVKSVVGSSLPSPDQGEGPSVARAGGVNVFRKDANPNESGAYSKDLINEFPEKEGNYLKVKKIL